MDGDGTAAATAAPDDDLATLRADYLAAVLQPDSRRAHRLLEGAADAGTPVQRLYLEVLQPVLHEVGRLWEQARIGVAHEHLATQITQSVLARLSARLAPAGAGHGRRAIVSCSPGELHVVGGRMVADFLEADGWSVLSLGADTPPKDLARLAAEEGAEWVRSRPRCPLICWRPAPRARRCAACRPRRSSWPAGRRSPATNSARAVGADAYAAGPGELLTLLAARFGRTAAVGG